MVNKNLFGQFIPAGAKVENVQMHLPANCPVMKMEPEEAREEITRLLNGEESKRVLKECTFCFTCNHYCPNGLKPYNLIMERIAEYNRKHKRQLPPWVVYMINGKTNRVLMNSMKWLLTNRKRSSRDGAKYLPNHKMYYLSAATAEPFLSALSGLKLCKICPNSAPGIFAAETLLTASAITVFLARWRKRLLTAYPY